MSTSGAAPRRRSANRLREDLVTYLVLVAMSLVTFVWFFPFAWALISSLMTTAELSAGGLRLPAEANWANYQQAFERMQYPRAFANSFIYAGGAAFLQCITGAMAAYAFARMSFPGRDLLFVLALATLMIPGTVTLTANFVILNELGWLNTHLALVIPHGASGFSIFLLRQFFMTIPRELEDAANLDGAGPLRFLWSVAVPLARPALVTVFVFIFISAYNDFLWPLIMTSSRDMRVLQIALRTFSEELGSGIIQGPLMAAAIITMIPTIALFVVAQKAFIRGITRSGMK
ncbi:N/A [soil metagenome]